MSSQEYQRGPISFEIAKWLGYIFAAMYILYGGVQIILGVLDRSYSGFAQWSIFLLLGVVLLVVGSLLAPTTRGYLQNND